jgi:hypothetical protein
VLIAFTSRFSDQATEGLSACAPALTSQNRSFCVPTSVVTKRRQFLRRDPAQGCCGWRARDDGGGKFSVETAYLAAVLGSRRAGFMREQ